LNSFDFINKKYFGWNLVTYPVGRSERTEYLWNHQ